MTNKTRVILFMLMVCASLLLTWAVSAGIETVRQMPMNEESER